MGEIFQMLMLTSDWHSDFCSGKRIRSDVSTAKFLECNFSAPADFSSVVRGKMPRTTGHGQVQCTQVSTMMARQPTFRCAISRHQPSFLGRCAAQYRTLQDWLQCSVPGCRWRVSVDRHAPEAVMRHLRQEHMLS